MLEASGQALPDAKPILEVNVGHPLVARLSSESDDARFTALSEIVLDHAVGIPHPRTPESESIELARLELLKQYPQLLSGLVESDENDAQPGAI